MQIVHINGRFSVGAWNRVTGTSNGLSERTKQFLKDHKSCS